MGLLDSASQPSLGINSSMPQFNGILDFLKSPQAMALSQGLLQAGAPSRLPMSLGQGLAQGMQNMQQATKDQQAFKMNQQTMDANDLSLKKSKADALADAMGSVHFAKPDQKAAAYTSALANAKRIGLDTTQWPQKYDAKNVDPMVETALTQSLGAKNLFANQIEMMKAQAEIALARANLDVKQQGVNTQAVVGGLPAPYPGLTGTMMNSTSGIPMMTATAGNNAKAAPSSNGGQSSSLAFPAQMAEQKKQAEDWAGFKNDLAKGSSNYQDVSNLINEARTDVGGSLIPTSPATGWLRENLSVQGDKLNKDSNKLQTELIKQMTGAGLNRMDIPIVKMVQQSTPANDRYAETNRTILDKYQAANEISGSIMPEIVQRLDDMGVKDRIKAQNIANRVLTGTGAFKADGSIDISKLQNWENVFNDITSGKQSSSASTTSNNSLEAWAAHAIQNGADPRAVAQRLTQLRGGNGR